MFMHRVQAPTIAAMAELDAAAELDLRSTYVQVLNILNWDADSIQVVSVSLK